MPGGFIDHKCKGVGVGVGKGVDELSSCRTKENKNVCGQAECFLTDCSFKEEHRTRVFCFCRTR